MADAPILNAARTSELRLHMSCEDYLNVIDESSHSEWVDGEVTIFMPPTDRHQEILVFLGTLLNLFLTAKRFGRVLHEPFEMKLRAGRSYRQPDLLVLLNEPLDRIDRQRLNGPVDIVVELVSPESVTRDRQEKLREYEHEGVGEYWIVDAREGQFAVDLYSRDESGVIAQILADAAGRVRSRVPPGLGIDHDWFVDDAIPRATRVYGELDPSYA